MFTQDYLVGEKYFTVYYYDRIMLEKGGGQEPRLFTRLVKKMAVHNHLIRHAGFEMVQRNRGCAPANHL